MPRTDLTIRPEIHHLLTFLKISPEDLLFTDDPPLSSLPKSTRITLVDHNKLEPALRTYFQESNVRGIIDHHHDEGGSAHAKPRIVEKSGSCASLVTNYFKEVFPASGVVRGELARLGLAAALIDTTNLSNKVTEHDTSAVEFLEGVINGMPVEVGGEAWDRQKFFDGIWNAKNDIDRMSLRDLLRKDWKEWTEGVNGKKVGIAAILRDLEWLRSRDGSGGQEAFLTGVKSWATERELDLVSVMTTIGQGEEFKREAMVWALGESVKQCVASFEEKAQREDLQLKPWSDGGLDSKDGERKAWRQFNLAASRKQVAPLLRESLREVEVKGGQSKV
ncbi:DHH phosphoesterase [Choiromyces venosus 120613-1]|uniref:DHH phosphoesterase n=1 Tax=Choiromyces venosus 120613-1 TaxID=1336337 RepID=A0A3N4JYW6_9PEZI|nr:DHH phosphoesterase [Choiromyces venosus 120613-1]